MARRRVVVRYGPLRQAMGFVFRHPLWVLGVLFVARVVGELGW